jgi:hypothetical protein
MLHGYRCLLAKIFFTATLLFPSWAATAGWGTSSEFAPYKKEGFDFAMSYPLEWQLGEESPGIGNCAEFGCFQETIVNNKDKFPDETSQVKVRFFQGLNLTFDELIEKIRLRHPEIPESAWKPNKLGTSYYPYITSGELQGKSPKELVTQEYFRISPDRVIQIESRAYQAGNGLYWVEKIKASIDRSSKGPEVIEIWWDKEKYVPGDLACLTIILTDTPGAIGSESLRDLRLEGDFDAVFEKKVSFSVFSEGNKFPDKKSTNSSCFKGTRSKEEDSSPSPNRNKEKSRFQIEIKVRSFFDTTNLKIRGLSFTSRNDGSTFCSIEWRSKGKDDLFSCINGSDSKHDKLYPRMSWAEVSNGSRDIESPVVSKLQLAKDRYLNIEASDQTEIAFAIVELENSRDKSGSKIILFPDQIGNGTLIDLSDKGNWGRNNINRILIVDSNKLHTEFKANSFGIYECKRVKLEKSESMYKRVHSSDCVAEFPVMSFSGGVRK